MAAVFPNWVDLPKEVTTKILRKVGAVDVLKSAQFVCTHWYSISLDPLLWRTIHVTHKSNNFDVITTAISRSCGQLEDITIVYPIESLLHHIANSGSNLRHLRLQCCSRSLSISNHELKECAKKLPLLEGLDLSNAGLSKDCVETIGQSCPLLKDLKFIKKRKYIIKGFIECDDDAFAIAKTMQNLRHLTLLGNWITNAGLLSILNGCPHLESLDLRGCLNLNLQDTSLKKACAAAQIKQLRPPHEYLAESSDDEFDISDSFTINSFLLDAIVQAHDLDLRNSFDLMESDPSDFFFE
ncbi:hypothetical protein PIB30_004809 [Stylosanthes scabra]|uniref:F-box domain-containing protein n=1 Tax=Stylosanthes scabra TaxID=79078 RepID=A0ABU6T5L2_9FABA|nr:hypothetical protein [Stylosanthes scabra]